MKKLALALACTLITQASVSLPVVAVAQTNGAQTASPQGVPTQTEAGNGLKASATETDNGVVVSPAPTKTISLSACFDEAERANREIKSALWNLPIAKAGIRAAGAVPNPTFQLQAGFGNSFEFLFTGQTQQYGFTQQLQTAGKRTKKIEVARANYGLSELQLDALRFDLHNRVRRAYAEVAAAEAYVALVESQREVGERLLKIASRRFEAGKAPKAEVLQAQLAVSQYDTQRNQAQGRLQAGSASLSQLLGERTVKVEVIDVDDNGIFKLSAEKTDIVPSPGRTPPNLQALLISANNNRPDLKTAQQQIWANKQALNLARVRKIPDLFVGVGGTYATFSPHQPAGVQAFGNWLGTGIFTSVTMENPVFYQYQGEVEQATSTLRQSERQLDLVKAQIATDVVTAYSEVTVARANISEFQTNLLPTAAQVAKLARRGYEVGANDLATAIVAQQQYQQTLSNYFDSVVAYQSAWADMEKAVGVPLRL